jgi:glycosyltransferase involved in cell wall biosynthesis
MKKILIFSTSYLPLVGGAEIAVKEITDRIGDFEFDMVTALIDKRIPKTEKVGNVNIHRVGLGKPVLDKFLLPFFGLKKAFELHKKNNYEIIWSIMASQASIAAAWFKKKNKKVKLLLTLQEGDEEFHLKRYVLNINWLYELLIKPWHLKVFNKADRVTAISKYLKNRAIKNGIKKEIINIIPNGVDTGKFNVVFNNLEIKEFKEEIGIKEDKKIVITISRLASKNGIESLIKAMTYLKYNNSELLIAGNVDEWHNLEFLASKLNLDDRVIFLGNVSHDRLPKYLAVSDVFCRPSISEGLGNVFLEAMAAKVPVIATSVGGIPDFLEDR